jgi:hypothetical protein
MIDAVSVRCIKATKVNMDFLEKSIQAKPMSHNKMTRKVGNI